MSTKKKKSLMAIMILAIIAIAAGAFAYSNRQAVPQASADELPGAMYVRQVITADSKDSRTIMWQSDSPIENPGVEYRMAGTGEIQQIAAKSEKYTDDGQNVVLYTARLENLPAAGAELEYRLTGDGRTGTWHSLKTDNGGGFTALIFPDSQSSDYSGWQELAQDAAKRNPETDFFINMGDLVDNGEDHSQWEAWFDALHGIIDRIPVAPLMGNHETYNRDWKVREPVAYLAEFAVPDNGSSHYGRYYYSYDYGPVHFIVLNTQQDELKDFAPNLLEEELAWFRQDVAASKQPWKVVLMHKDVLQYRIEGRPERTEGLSEDGEIWMPLFEEAGIDAVLSAHLHTYRNRGHILNYQHNPAGPLYILTGVAGNVRYPNLWTDHALDEYVAPQPETDNYLVMKAAADKIDIFCYLPDGTELDHAVLEK